MKTFERQVAGYSEQGLESLFRSTLFPSSFFDQPVPVRGVCFAAGADSPSMARTFAETQLGLGTISFQMAAMTTQSWGETVGLFTRPKAELSKVGFILRDLDLAASVLQEKIADTLNGQDNTPWFATVADHRKLSPKLKLSFLVYLGLSPARKMRFLAQSGQLLQIDEGTLKPPGG